MLVYHTHNVVYILTQGENFMGNIQNVEEKNLCNVHISSFHLKASSINDLYLKDHEKIHSMLSDLRSALAEVKSERDLDLVKSIFNINISVSSAVLTRKRELFGGK